MNVPEFTGADMNKTDNVTIIVNMQKLKNFNYFTFIASKRAKGSLSEATLDHGTAHREKIYFLLN